MEERRVGCFKRAILSQTTPYSQLIEQRSCGFCAPMVVLQKSLCPVFVAESFSRAAPTQEFYPVKRPTVGHERFVSCFPHSSEIHTQGAAVPVDFGSKPQPHAAGELPQQCSAPALVGVSYRASTGAF